MTFQLTRVNGQGFEARFGNLYIPRKVFILAIGLITPVVYRCDL